MRDLECQNSENLNVLSSWDRQQTGQEANWSSFGSQLSIIIYIGGACSLLGSERSKERDGFESRLVLYLLTN